ncbi:MAG: helix-turn-helix domain-containing protein [bacterium]|nr:helix-turn-helix domain-containing protein [bacterium]MCM1424945.1 helix-turn-helix domain-containing protein [bacterium]
MRKRDNITQEQLAEQLNVSRQSVSKWESDTSYPEMEKLLLLCSMFHCSMDDLVQGNIRDINVSDKSDYEHHMNSFAKWISFGVCLILFGLSASLFIYGMNYFITNPGMIKEDFIGLIFLVFVTVAVAIFIVTGIQHSAFVKKNPAVDNFYSQKEIDAFNKKFSIMITAGVLAILIGVILLMGIEIIYPELENDDYLESLLMCVFLLFITAGTTIIVYAGMQKRKHNIEYYNASNDKESLTYKKEKLSGTVCGCIMMIATIVYLILTHFYGEWGMPTAVVFAVGGISCGIASVIIDFVKK